MNNSLHILITFLNSRIQAGQHDFDGRYLYLHNLSVDDFSSLQSNMVDVGLQVEGSRAEVTIDLHGTFPDNTLIFFDKAHFIRSYEKYKGDFNEKNLVILNLSNHFLIKERAQGFSKELALFFNFYFYRQILSFLLDTADFTAVHKEAQHQFVILSLEKGTFHIGYNPIEGKIDMVHDLAPLFEELKSSFAKIEFVNFFKDSIIQAVGKDELEDRFWALISSLRATLSFADRDLQIYVRKFAFDKIKSKFKEEKVKYFESLEKNIESLNKQVVAFPLTFAASAFASYQVKDKPIILLFILLAYCAYTWVAFRILTITKYNIDTTKGDVKKESERIEATYDVLFNEFEDDFKKINKKIDLLERLACLIKWVLIGLLGLFTAFSFYSVSIVVQPQTSQAKTPLLEDKRQSGNAVAPSSEYFDTSLAPKMSIKKPIDSVMNKLQDSVTLSTKASDSRE